jgi:SNF2 family DNA or RNA helicase
MNVIVYMGNPESREIMREREFYFKDLSKRGGAKNKSRVPKFNVVITSYDTAINDIYTLKRIYWECLVVDEAHRLKNNESKFFKTSQMIRTKHKVLLTGTPLQNNIIELLNLIEFITPAKAKSLKSYDSLKVFM